MWVKSVVLAVDRPLPIFPPISRHFQNQSTKECGADLRRLWARENSDVQLAAACNGTTSVKCVPLVDFCLVNSAPS